MANNKWESQCIKRKFNNKHKNINFSQTQKRNKKTNHRKIRSLNKLYIKQDLKDNDILNIKTLKGHKIQYSSIKQPSLHPKSPQLKANTNAYKLNYCVTASYYHSNTWIHFMGWFNSLQYWQCYSSPKQNYFPLCYPTYNDTVLIDILLIRTSDKRVVFKILQKDEHFDKYYIKKHQEMTYIFKCFQKFKFHKFSMKNKNMNITQYLKIIRNDDSKLCNLKEHIFENIRNHIDIEIIEENHANIMKTIARYNTYKPQKISSYFGCPTHGTSCSSYDCRSHWYITKNENVMNHHANKVSIMMSMILERMDQYSYVPMHHICDRIFLKEQIFKLKCVNLRTHFFGSNIIDSYQVNISDSSDIKIPMKEITNLEDFSVACWSMPNKQRMRYQTSLMYCEGKQLLSLAMQCMKMETVKGKYVRDNKKVIINNNCLRKTTCNALPITFDFIRLIIEYIPSCDIIKNVLIPYLRGFIFYYCVDKMNLKFY
eukprot:37104_1